MIVSIVFPVYNEEGNVQALYKRLNDVAQAHKNIQFEFVFVDDCSKDATAKLLKDIFEKDSRVQVLRFARNSGSHAALSAGLRHCRGNCAVVMAADLQDPPELIPSLVEEWKKGSKVVWGVRSKREKESFTTKLFSRIYYQIINRLTAIKLPEQGADVFLADRMAIDALNKIDEKHTSIFMTLAWLGFKESSIQYVKQGRFSGTSKWSLSKKIKIAIDSVLSFSDAPIKWMSALGGITICIGSVYGIYLLINQLSGWPVVLAAVFIIGGLQMVMLGVLGEYLWRTYDESRNRPRYILEYVLSRQDEEGIFQQERWRQKETLS